MTIARNIFATFAALSLFAVARAQTPPAPLTPDELSTILAPSLDNQTLLVAHLDTARVDVGAIESFLTELLDAGKVPVGDQHRKNVAQIRLVLDAYVSKFQSVGGRHAFFVLSHADLWPFTEPPVGVMLPVAILLPVEKGADPKPLLDFLQSQPIPPEQNYTAELLPNNTIFFGTKRTLAHLKSLTPQPRPELLTALASLPDAALQVAYAPTSDMRRVISEMMPTFPADSPIMPNVSTDFLGRNVKFVSLSINLPPDPSAALIASMNSPQDAAQLKTFVKATLQYIKTLPDYQHLSPDPAHVPPEVLALQLFMKDLEDDLTTSPNSSELTLRFDTAQLRAFFQFAEPAFAAEREQAAHMKTMDVIRQLLIAGNAYAADHKGAWPVTLDETRAALGKPPESFQTNLEYHEWSAADLKKLSPAQTPVIWEISDDERAHIAVGFIDAHVELVADKNALKELLQKADQQLHPK